MKMMTRLPESISEPSVGQSPRATGMLGGIYARHFCESSIEAQRTMTLTEVSYSARLEYGCPHIGQTQTVRVRHQQSENFVRVRIEPGHHRRKVVSDGSTVEEVTARVAEVKHIVVAVSCQRESASKPRRRCLQVSLSLQHAHPVVELIRQTDLLVTSDC